MKPVVLIVTQSLGRGGAERQAVLTARGLAGQGASILLFVCGGSDSIFRDGLAAGFAVDRPDGGEGIGAQLQRLSAAVRSFRPDVVVTFLRGADLRFGVVRLSNSAARRAAWILSVRGNLSGPGMMRSPLATLAHAWCIKRADRVVVNSGSLAANVLAVLGVEPSKVSIVPNVVCPVRCDADAARRAIRELIGRKSEGLVLGCLGSFQEDRNYVLLAEALPEVLRAYPKAHAIIFGRAVGVGVSTTRFLRAVERNGIAQHVTIAGEVASARDLICGLDAFVLPSKLEGSSNALAEALAAGAAIATTPVADAELLAAGTAVVSQDWTARAFAGAIVTAFAQRETLRARARARGTELLQQRSPERVASCWEALIHETVAPDRGGLG